MTSSREPVWLSLENALNASLHHRIDQQSREQQQSRVRLDLKTLRHKAGSLMSSRLTCQTEAPANAASPTCRET